MWVRLDERINQETEKSSIINKQIIESIMKVSA